MSDYEHSIHSRNYPPNHLASSGSGAGLFWVLLIVAVLGLLVLIGGIGGGTTTVDHPGGAGTEGVIVPADPGTATTEGAAVIIE